MAFDYSALIPTVSGIIDEFEMGTISILRRTESQSASNPWDYTVTESETNINAIVTGVSEDKVDNESILNSDLFVLLASDAVSQAPEISDLIKIDSENFSIIKVKSIPPAGTVILYRCQCRRI